jgi:hypothetical protein
LAPYDGLLPKRNPFPAADCLIDALAYELYGFTQQEITIVEGEDRR